MVISPVSFVWIYRGVRVHASPQSGTSDSLVCRISAKNRLWKVIFFMSFVYAVVVQICPLIMRVRCEESACKRTAQSGAGGPKFSIIDVAEAATPRSYADLKQRLSSKDVNVRIAARRILGDNCELYKDEALRDLFANKYDNIDYVVSLLHGLIAGVDKATMGKLSPGQARDLSVSLPYISSRLYEIVKMTGDPHEEIQKQARRLVERFPVNGFKMIYDEMQASLRRNCSGMTDADQRIRWGSIFFYYNRIVQYMYETGPLSRDSLSSIDAMTQTVLNGSECLQTDLKIDAGAIYFARAVVFDHRKEPPKVIATEIEKFNDHIERLGGPTEYYSQSQFDAIRDLEIKYLAQQSDDVVVTTHHVDAVREARIPWDEVENCLRDTACAVAINAIAAQVGVPANAIRLVNAGAAFTARAEGEETRYSIPALSGRKICRVQVRTTSVVPATGDRASLFSITAAPETVRIYTWTPRQGIGAGRSWYDGMVFVAHIKAALADDYAKSGKCTVPQSGKATTYECRGASGVNHGIVACGSKDL